MKKLISKRLIPSTLLETSNGCLILPPILSESWIKLLKDYSLMEQALTKSPDGLAGGVSEQDTKDHFAWKFMGSCSRVILPFLDLSENMGDISNTLIKMFSGNKIFLADLPCGSGAASLGLLCTVNELRKKKILPQMPLDITILGGEISPTARLISNEYFELIKNDLEAQAIFVNFQTVEWDVCNKMSSRFLIRKIIEGQNNADVSLLLITNFSDYLERSGKFKVAKSQLEELFSYFQNQNSFALWIEPNRNDVATFFSRVFTFLRSFIKNIFRYNQEKTYETQAMVAHPLKEIKFRTNASVINFHLTHEDSNEA